MTYLRHMTHWWMVNINFTINSRHYQIMWFFVRHFLVYKRRQGELQLNGDTLFRILYPKLKIYVYVSKEILDPTKMNCDRRMCPKLNETPIVQAVVDFSLRVCSRSGISMALLIARQVIIHIRIVVFLLCVNRNEEVRGFGQEPVCGHEIWIRGWS